MDACSALAILLAWRSRQVSRTPRCSRRRGRRLAAARSRVARRRPSPSNFNRGAILGAGGPAAHPLDAGIIPLDLPAVGADPPNEPGADGDARLDPSGHGIVLTRRCQSASSARGRTRGRGPALKAGSAVAARYLFSISASASPSRRRSGSATVSRASMSETIAPCSGDATTTASLPRMLDRRRRSTRPGTSSRYAPSDRLGRLRHRRH